MQGGKTVEIMMRVAVPEWARWLGWDGAGSVWAFENKPTARSTWWDADGQQLMVAEANWWYVDNAVTDGDLYLGWRESLKEIGHD